MVIYLEIELYSFDKKKNSTKRPVSGSGWRQDGQLKTPFTVTELAVTFNLGATANAPRYNYCYIPNLWRYYFIVNWSYDGGLWTAACVEDVLATFKPEIGGSQQYVERSYSSYNPNILDTAYMTRADDVTRLYSVLVPSTFWGASAWGSNGTIVIGVVGASSYSTGAVTYYAMAQNTFGNLMNTMLGGISWANISASEISTELQKALINPTQYIVSCRWYPIVFSGFTQGAPTTFLQLGWWTFNLSGTARILNSVSSAWISRENEFSIPKNPWKNARTGYMDLSPYTEYYLKFLPFGVFEIDGTELYDMAYMGVHVDVDLMTGSAILKVAAKPFTGSYIWENAFLVTEGQIGVTIPIGQVAADIGKYKNALVAGGASALAEILG